MSRTHALAGLELHLTNHFQTRIQGRFPGLWTTEESLRGELEHADWYPGPREDTYYAVADLLATRVVFVIQVGAHALDLVTVYEPQEGWHRRFAGERAWPAGLVAAAAGGVKPMNPPRHAGAGERTKRGGARGTQTTLHAPGGIATA